MRAKIQVEGNNHGNGKLNVIHALSIIQSFHFQNAYQTLHSRALPSLSDQIVSHRTIFFSCSPMAFGPAKIKWYDMDLREMVENDRPLVFTRLGKSC